MNIVMQRDNRDAWPDDVPVGTFDITPGTYAGHTATAHIMFVCPNGKRCSILLGPEFVGRKNPDDLNVWQWDGNIDQPTIRPSINCVGGCGAHFFITSGIMG